MTKKKSNPEQSVVEDIDALITESLSGGEPYGGEWHAPLHDNEGDLLCPVCADEWHGLKNAWCPGAYATPAQKGAFTKKIKAKRFKKPRRKAGSLTAQEDRNQQMQAIARVFEVPETMITPVETEPSFTMVVDGPATVRLSGSLVTMHGAPSPRGILALQDLLQQIRQHMNLFDQDS